MHCSHFPPAYAQPSPEAETRGQDEGDHPRDPTDGPWEQEFEHLLATSRAAETEGDADLNDEGVDPRDTDSPQQRLHTEASAEHSDSTSQLEHATAEKSAGPALADTSAPVPTYVLMWLAVVMVQIPAIVMYGLVLASLTGQPCPTGRSTVHTCACALKTLVTFVFSLDAQSQFHCPFGICLVLVPVSVFCLAYSEWFYRDETYLLRRGTPPVWVRKWLIHCILRAHCLPLALVLVSGDPPGSRALFAYARRGTLVSPTHVAATIIVTGIILISFYLQLRVCRLMSFPVSAVFLCYHLAEVGGVVVGPLAALLKVAEPEERSTWGPYIIFLALAYGPLAETASRLWDRAGVTIPSQPVPPKTRKAVRAIVLSCAWLAWFCLTASAIRPELSPGIIVPKVVTGMWVLSTAASTLLSSGEIVVEAVSLLCRAVSMVLCALAVLTAPRTWPLAKKWWTVAFLLVAAGTFLCNHLVPGPQWVAALNNSARYASLPLLIFTGKDNWAILSSLAFLGVTMASTFALHDTLLTQVACVLAIAHVGCVIVIQGQCPKTVLTMMASGDFIPMMTGIWAMTMRLFSTFPEASPASTQTSTSTATSKKDD